MKVADMIIHSLTCNPKEWAHMYGSNYKNEKRNLKVDTDSITMSFNCVSIEGPVDIKLGFIDSIRVRRAFTRWGQNKVADAIFEIES